MSKKPISFSRPFFILFFSIIFFSSSLSAQEIRGFYVNDFKNIIGDPVKEDQLLSFAQENNFNYLLLYNLYFIHRDLFDITNPASAMPLANFIHKAKTNYGIQQVAAIGEKFASFNTIDAYNQLYAGDDSRQFDVYHIEFEFWHTGLVENYYCSTYLADAGYPCTKSGAFEFFYNEFQRLKNLTQSKNLMAETYIGNTTTSQSQQIGAIADRVLVHYYRKSDTYKNGNSIYNFKKYRLADLSPPDKVLDVLPIFSSRSYFMGPWLLDNPEEQAFDTFMNGQNGFVEEDGAWKDQINIQGYTWYRYTELYDNMMGEASSRDAQVVDESLKESHIIDRLNAKHLQTLKKANNFIDELNISYFPNPADKIVHIVSDHPEPALVKVVDIFGKTMSATFVSSNYTDQLVIDHLNSGFYFIVFELTGQTVVRKLYVE